MLNSLLIEGFPAFIVYDDGIYKVQVGAYGYLANAIKMEERLRRFRYNTYITTWQIGSVIIKSASVREHITIHKQRRLWIIAKTYLLYISVCRNTNPAFFGLIYNSFIYKLTESSYCNNVSGLHNSTVILILPSVYKHFLITEHLYRLAAWHIIKLGYNCIKPFRWYNKFLPFKLNRNTCRYLFRAQYPALNTCMLYLIKAICYIWDYFSGRKYIRRLIPCLLYTSDAADE